MSEIMLYEPGRLGPSGTFWDLLPFSTPFCTSKGSDQAHVVLPCLPTGCTDNAMSSENRSRSKGRLVKLLTAQNKHYHLLLLEAQLQLTVGKSATQLTIRAEQKISSPISQGIRLLGTKPIDRSPRDLATIFVFQAFLRVLRQEALSLIWPASGQCSLTVSSQKCHFWGSWSACSAPYPEHFCKTVATRQIGNPEVPPLWVIYI